MKNARSLVVGAITIAFLACTALISFGTRERTADNTVRAVGSGQDPSSAALRQTDVEQLMSSQQLITQEQDRLALQNTELIAKQELLVQRLDALSGELTQLYGNLAAKSSNFPLPLAWHQRLIERNRVAYDAIRVMLASLTEDEFPTARTWYGNAWNELTKPFRDHAFPTVAQRDKLVQLLGEIAEGERQRLAKLQGQATVVSVATEHTAISTASCFGATWNALTENLRRLEY
jgi:hypothetical protein